ncbi:MAG: helix-turn-helix domain-containing protein [Candidatus Atabeyarchaeum deiterrae]
METVIRDRMVSQLKELGLSTHETLTYVTLLTQPSITAGTLCNETGIPDSKIYYALDALSKKGMLIVQKSNPSIYLPVAPKEAIANLKQQLTESLNEKVKQADVLIDMMTPIYESAKKSEELQFAYIIKGQNNIINRMKALIETAQKEITVFISHSTVLKGLKESLTDARQRRRVKLNVAMTQELFEREDSSNLGEIRLLCCSVGMLISDMKTLVTLSDWIDQTAMLTQDQNLIRVARDYYDNPSVAQVCNCVGGRPQAPEK